MDYEYNPMDLRSILRAAGHAIVDEQRKQTSEQTRIADALERIAATLESGR